MVRVFSMKSCSYCDELKTKLNELKIGFIEIDINSKKGKEEFSELSKAVKTDYVPIVIIDKNVLVPEVSFQTIEQAINIIKELITKQ